MNKYFIATGTVTYAMKGREILRKNGFSAEVKRLSGNMKGFGCGYGLVTYGEKAAILKTLTQNGVRYLSVLPEK